jgi:hypothetical protein
VIARSLIAFAVAATACGNEPEKLPIPDDEIEVMETAKPPPPPPPEGSASETDRTPKLTRAPDAGTARPPAAPASPDLTGYELVAQIGLEQHRIAGDRHIPPPADVARTIAASDRTRVVSTWKVCVDLTGAVSHVEMLKSTGLAKYDRQIAKQLRRWRFRPMLLEGKPAAVCTSTTQLYRP